MKILIVGGNWEKNKSRPSSLVNKMYNCLQDYLKEKYTNNSQIELYNGGLYNELEPILQSVVNFDIVFWMANVPNNLPKIRDVKAINPKVMLITSKRNVDNKYTFEDLLQKSLKSKSNLMIEFTKSSLNGLYNMKVFDPLACIWYDGTNIKDMIYALADRLMFIQKVTRQSTIKNEENKEDLTWFFNQFKSKIYHSDKTINESPIPNEFLEIVKDYAPKFAYAMANGEADKIERFLGNSSLRCPKGFPSVRGKDYIFVSRRNISKDHIELKDFVPVYTEDNKIFFCGDNKPSVDTPIQIRLYQQLPNINYMIHGHCYIKNACITDVALPCGAIEEVDEIIKCIRKNYNNDLSRTFYILNLKGHGCIMMANFPNKLKNIEIIGRPQPEKII